MSLAIWQEVFKLQDDWDVSIREAASILIQLCAPEDSVRHFHKMAREQYHISLNQALANHGSEPFSINKNQSTADGVSQGNELSTSYHLPLQLGLAKSGLINTVQSV